MSASFTRLVWKDAMLVRTILLVVSLAIVFTYFATVISYLVNPVTFREGYSLTLMLSGLFPGLVAFGIPALLIGTEEESGTLSWLRTLPIPRRNVIYSKLLVAIGTVALTWALCLIALLCVGLILPLVNDVSRGEDLQEIAIFSAYFSFVLLLVGFVTNYLFRSPITGLLTAIPFMIVGMLICGSLYACAIWAGFSDERHNFTWPFMILGVGSPVLLVVLQHRLALRRLQPVRLPPSDSTPFFSLTDTVHISAEQTDNDYCLNLKLRLPIPRLVRAATAQNLQSRPTQTRALLWQAASQQAAPVSLLAAIVIVAGLFWSKGGIVQVLLIVPICLGMCWLGSMTFYADTLRRRHFYFSDRGISRNRVWLTRLALPCLALSIISFELWWLNRYHWFDIYPLPMYVGIVGFAIGSLASMTAPRPVLGLLIGPVLLIVFMVPMGFVFGRGYSDYFPALTLAAIPILFATWRLLSRWSKAQRGLGFDARVVGYIMLGLLTVCVYIFAHRVATIPAELPEWRAAMLAEKVEKPDSFTGSIPTYFEAQSAFNAQPRYDINSQTAVFMNVLNETRKAREGIVNGELDPKFLFSTVERDEAAVLNLNSWRATNPEDMPYVVPLTTALASDSLRRQSRSVALNSEWRAYQERSWRDAKLPGMPYRPKYFGPMPVAYQHANFSFERLRADRFVDAATKATLEYLASGQVIPSDAEYDRLKWLWANAFDTQSVIADTALPISLEADTVIAKFRARLAAPNNLSSSSKQVP